jgi:hypothetical protein
MPISRERNCGGCASASRPISMSTCTAARQVFKGRIEGFTMGTGSTLALLPPENATGNFVKIVQRLPVRLRQQQASSLVYFDVFFLLALVTLIILPVLLLMKRSAAKKGAQVAA